MSESKKKSGGNFKAQSAITIGRNKRLKAERHQKRMTRQAESCWLQAHGQKTKRGTARELRRAEAFAAKIRNEAVNLNPIAVAMAETS